MCRSERGRRCPPLTLSIGDERIEESLKLTSKLDCNIYPSDNCSW